MQRQRNGLPEETVNVPHLCYVLEGATMMGEPQTTLPYIHCPHCGMLIIGVVKSDKSTGKVLDDLDRLSGWIGFQIENRRAHNAFCKESRRTYRKVLKKIIELKELRQQEREQR